MTSLQSDLPNLIQRARTELTSFIDLFHAKIALL